MWSSNLNRFSSKMLFSGSGRGQGKGRKEGRIVHLLCPECTELLGTKQSLSLWWSYEMVGYAFFINLLISWLVGTTICRQYGSPSTLLEHLCYTMIWVTWWIQAIIIAALDRSRLGVFAFHFHFKWKQFWLPIRPSMSGKSSVTPSHHISWFASVIMKTLRS